MRADDAPAIGSASPVSGLDGRPDADDPAKPRAPWSLRKPFVKQALRNTAREFIEDSITDLAAGLTYFSVLSTLPAIIVLVTLVSLLGGEGGVAIIAMLNDLQSAGFVPENAARVIVPVIEATAAVPAPGIGLAIGVLSAIWAASKYVRAFGRALNQIYEVPEGRNVIRLNLELYGLTAVILLLVAVSALALTVSGPFARALGYLLGLGDSAQAAWDIGRQPLLFLMIGGIVALLYRFSPNVKQSRLRWIALGALVGIVIAGVASWGFAFYVTHSSGLDAALGALAGASFFLLWLWVMNMALLFGAELNSEIERARQLQGGIAAERYIQLPPRSTKDALKAAKWASGDAERGRKLRLGENPDPEDAAVEESQPEGRQPINHYPSLTAPEPMERDENDPG